MFGLKSILRIEHNKIKDRKIGTFWFHLEGYNQREKSRI